MSLSLSTTPSWLHRTRHGLVSLAFVLLAVIASGCGDDDEDVPIVPAQPALVEGRVDGDAGFGKGGSPRAIEGAVVTLARVQANGSLETISADTVHTNAAGEFSVETLSADERQNVVVAMKDGITWKSVVTARTTAGGSIQSQPLNDESTVEADVHARVIAHGTPSASFYTDVAADVDAAVAALIRGNAETIDQAATSIEVEAQTNALFLSDSSIAVTQAELQALGGGRIEAHEGLESALDAAADSSAVAAALEQFYDALLAAHVDANVTPGVAAQARESGARALIRSSAALDTDARFALARATARPRIHFMSKTVQQRLTMVDAMQPEIDAAVSAGRTLAAAIDASTSGASMDSAFADYHDTIVTTLQTAAETDAAAIGALDTTIRGPGGAKAALETAVSMAATTLALANAYLDFRASVSTLTFAALPGATTAEATAIAEILIVTNMALSTP